MLLVDDFDTDEDCRNPDVLNNKWDWWEHALYPTRDPSGSLLVVFCGNIIAEDCCIVRAGAVDLLHHIRDLRNLSNRAANVFVSAGSTGRSHATKRCAVLTAS